VPIADISEDGYGVLTGGDGRRPLNPESYVELGAVRSPADPDSQPMCPQVPGQDADQRGEDRTVGPVQVGPGMGAAQHGHLVPQYEQFDVLRRRGTAEQDHPAAEPDEGQVEQTQRHG
jgi:hypothetical protein